MMQLRSLSQSIGRRQAQYQLSVYLLTGVVLTAAVVLFLFNPKDGGIFPPSPFRLLTGLYCPGCGTLRGLHQLLHGHLMAALDLNPLMVVASPYLIYSYACYVSPVFFRRKLPRLSIPPQWIKGILVVILAYWVLRNIPVFPFSWLAP